MKFSSRLLQFLLQLRYRVNITGLELLEGPDSKLILPSHIALIDPVILYAFFCEYGKLRPVVTESYYNNLILKPFFRLMGAIPVPDLEKKKHMEYDSNNIIGNMIKNLNNGDNVLLYPQGALARQGFQSIVGKKGAFYAVKGSSKSTKILTVSVRGLRGSRSSRAWNGKSPSLMLFLLKGLRFTLANLIFLVPRRTINIKITDNTQKLRKITSKGIDAFNRELEKIYNSQGEEKINYLSGLFRYDTVKYHKTPTKIIGSIADLQRAPFPSSIEVPNNVMDAVISIIKKIKPEYKGEFTLDTNLVLDCFFDSLDMAELKSSIQSDFSNSSNPSLLDIKTVGDVAIMAMGKSIPNEELKPCDWKTGRSSRLIFPHIKNMIHEDSTILSVMKDSFKDSKSDDLCYDTIFGIQSKKDFLIKAYLIADLLKNISGERVAVMLPSLSATALLIAGCYLAKKVPVMLNWTQSSEAFAHCLKSQNIETILTSKAFFQKIQTPRLKKYHMTFFEDMLQNISLKQKLSAVYQAYRFRIPNDISKTAVVLFTSGSEALPKTVELTHQNLLQDLLGAAGLMGMKMNDIEICFLPPFHSFGFILGIVLPLVSGMRTVFTPDPNDSKIIANLIEHTKASRLASTPTFLNGIIESSKENQLNSLRIAVVGAEKCPNKLFTKFAKKAPHAAIVEGYGITECSPIISVNPLKSNMKIKRGTVGLPIVGLKIKVIDLETNKELPANREGMICVRGANVFSGYVDQSLESPFIEIDGKQRYKTGDLGFLDKDGYLTISGRLKRFVKVAGEMISLPAIESVLSRKWKSTSGVEVLALESQEKSEGEVRLILFSTEKITVSDVNKYLREQGISNLVSIDEVIQVKEIPMLGTGKVDHVQLKKLLEGEKKTKKKRASK